MSNKLILRFSLREIMGVLLMAVALFWSAGQISWWPAWAQVIVTALWAAGTGFVIIRHNPDLLAERLGPRSGAKKWDTFIMSIYGLIQLAMLIVAGLDQRYGWSVGYPIPAQISGLLLVALGHSLAVWATAVNNYFSQIVRLQSERGHQVVDKGPYRFVRHPGYLGSIMTSIGTPILLASHWALLLGAFGVLLMVLRTYLEDRMLKEELAGYQHYSTEVQQRLLPGVW
jgi:protein-S-isoprenylcysteine O-methyltransferase Ste14